MQFECSEVDNVIHFNGYIDVVIDLSRRRGRVNPNNGAALGKGRCPHQGDGHYQQDKPNSNC